MHTRAIMVVAVAAAVGSQRHTLAGREPRRLLPQRRGRPGLWRHGDMRDADGVVFKHYAGLGYRFQPLLSFGNLNCLVPAHDAPAARRLACGVPPVETMPPVMPRVGVSPRTAGSEFSRGDSIAAMNARGIHHVGVAVEDLDDAVATYERLFGAEFEGRAAVAEQGVEAAVLRVGSSRVELLASLGEDTPVARFLARRGPGMHHVAYEVDDIEAALADLAECGAELIDEEPREGLFGLQVAFVHPDAVHGVLSEVVARG